MKLTLEQIQEAHALINILEDQYSDLSRFSAENDDLFDVQLVTLEQLLKDLRKQLL